MVLREGPKPTRPRGRIPRVARLLALAHHFEELLKTGAVETQAEIAELAKLTPARVTQLMNLLCLAPDIQEEIFFLPPVIEGAAGGDRATPTAGAEDGRMEGAEGAVGGGAADALAYLL